MPSTIDLWIFSISTYAIMILIAFVISLMVLLKTSGKLKKIDILCSYSYSILGFIVGAKILSFLDNNMEGNVLNSGYAFVGGVIGSVLAIAIYSKQFNIKLKELLSNYIVIYPLIYSIGKIGCLLGNCCFGKQHNGLFYIRQEIDENIVNVFPIQIVETVIMFILFVILLRYKSRNNSELKLISVFLIGFGLFRFIIDYFRYLRNTIFMNLTLSQMLCILFVLMGIYLITFNGNSKKIVRNQ
ncbi:MAG: prolipoprotein diacylglyceryl transferase [Oscillospiraceae bacterium]|nr:prolipoprotein diacylglyceryl transferase [Oscillospiraceae bacterium]